MPDTFWDLFACYSAFWLVIAVVVFRLFREQTNLSVRLEELEKSTESRRARFSETERKQNS